jgi:hypothetical protein
MPGEAKAIAALAQHVPSLGVTLATPVIPDAQPITLGLAFPANLATGGPAPDFAVIGRLDGDGTLVFPIVS